MAPCNQNLTHNRLRSLVTSIALLFWTHCLMAEPACAQETTRIPTPKFRERTDPNASVDADALREQLRYLVDAKGPINPLSDYGKSPNHLSFDKPGFKFSTNEDPDGRQAPKLDQESARRLKASGMTVPSSTLGVITLLPPPQLRPSPGSAIYYDDGFTPSSNVINSSVITAGAALQANIGDSIIKDGAVRVASFYQDDPIANIPPTLNSPPVISGGTLPGGGSLPGSIPTIPQGVPQAYQPSAPAGLPPASPTVVPGFSQPSTPQPAIPPPTIPSTSVPTTVLPAPPTYYVPSPTVQQGPAPGASTTQPGVPYAATGIPTYNRPASYVNSAPFVSAPPAAVDARSMVSSAVWQQQGANAAAQACNPSPSGSQGPRTPAPPGMVAPTVPMGINGVAPTSGLVPPTNNASPFAYAPPAAMPPATIYAPANGGYVPLVGFGQGASAQLGRGLYGQPTAYVDGQPVRNFLRYIFP